MELPSQRVGTLPGVASSRLLALALAGILAGCAANPIGAPLGDLRGAESGPPTLEVAVVAGDDLTALPEATVVVDGAALRPDAAGAVEVPWRDGPLPVEVSAPGFHPAATTLDEYPPGGVLEFRLEPVVLDGRVQTPNGFPLPGAVVELGASRDVTNDEGAFVLERAEPGTVVVTRPGYVEREIPWNGDEDRLDVLAEPVAVHALRVGPDAAADPQRWQALLALADGTGIDALVVEVKDDRGVVFHDTEVERAHEIGAVEVRYDLDAVVEDLDDHGLYGIARVAVFQDPFLAAAEPEHAVVDEATGAPWRSAAGHAWLDPSDPGSYEYAISLAEEACRRGFDEIQFDYVSYPFGGDVSTAVFDGGYTQEVRIDSVLAFLERATSVLHPLGCAVGTTILGITLESSTDEGVGQRPGPLSRVVDVISPMLYTTNYGSGWRGFDDPNLHGPEIVDGALAAGLRELEGHGTLRPWLQTWTIGADGILAVETVAEERVGGWMLWSTDSTYDPAALPP